MLHILHVHAPFRFEFLMADSLSFYLLHLKVLPPSFLLFSPFCVFSPQLFSRAIRACICANTSGSGSVLFEEAAYPLLALLPDIGELSGV